jgi:cell division protein FtsB
MEFTLVTILVLAAVAVAFTFLGVLLGRRSATANSIVDRTVAKYEAEREELRQQLRELQAKAKEAKDKK